MTSRYCRVVNLMKIADVIDGEWWMVNLIVQLMSFTQGCGEDGMLVSWTDARQRLAVRDLFDEAFLVWCWSTQTHQILPDMAEGPVEDDWERVCAVGGQVREWLFSTLQPWNCPNAHFQVSPDDVEDRQLQTGSFFHFADVLRIVCFTFIKQAFMAVDGIGTVVSVLSGRVSAANI